nr:MAG TPA: hypothetical protein [Caudoviricetes sp.]
MRLISFYHNLINVFFTARNKSCNSSFLVFMVFVLLVNQVSFQKFCI